MSSLFTHFTRRTAHPCSSVKPQSHTSSLGSGVELSERTASSKVRSETVDSIFSAVAKKKVVTSDKGTENFDSGNTGTTSKPPSVASWSSIDLSLRGL